MKFVRFLMVGGASAVVQFMILTLCLRIFDFWYQFAVGIAYTASVVFHFLANRRFTFQLEGEPKFEEIFRYLMIVICNLVITLLVSAFVVEFLGANAYSATALSISITVGVTFLTSKYWIFKKRESL